MSLVLNNRENFSETVGAGGAGRSPVQSLLNEYLRERRQPLVVDASESAAEHLLCAHEEKALEEDGNRVVKLLTRLFERFDADNNGYLGMTEINAALRDRTLNRDQAILVALLKENFGKIKDFSKDQTHKETEISQADMAELVRLWKGQLGTAEERALHGRLQSDIRYYRTHLEEANLNLYGDRNNPANSVVPEACIQAASNCHFMAGLASMAAVNPNAIMNMIRDNGNGSYTVTFPGKEPITVPAPSEAEIAYYDLASRHGTWSAVMQMAYGRYWSPRGDLPFEGAGGSVRNDGQVILTGTNIVPVPNAIASCELMHNLLEQNLVTNRLPVSARRRWGFSRDLELDNTGLRSGHEYAVTSFRPNAANPEAAVIVLRDTNNSVNWKDGKPPEGVRDLGRGNFEMPLRVFKQLFTSLGVSLR